jgi:hypothetical protein
MTITPAPPPPRRLNPAAILIGLATLIALGPSILKHQREHEVPSAAQRAWRMPEIVGQTQSDLVGRFGPPLSTKDYSLLEGSFAGPEVGLKHYYVLKDRGYAAHLKDVPETWTYPQYTTIREMIWQLPDSYLTVWLHEPRAEVSLAADTMEFTLPSTDPNEWVALDDYRIDKGLLAKPPAVR